MTTCPYQFRIQAYLDGELPREERKAMALHVESCTLCRTTLHSLKRLSEWTDTALSETLSPPSTLADLNVDAAWTVFQNRLAAARVVTATATTTSRRRWIHMAKTTKKWLVGTAAAVVLLGSLTIPAVQAKADEVLSLFRAEKIQAIQITPQDLNQMQEWIASGKAGEVNLQGLGKVWSTDDSSAEQNFSSAAEAQAAGFAQTVPTGYHVDSVNVHPEHTLHFQLNVERANALLKQLGSNSTFDLSLNNQDFSVQWPQTLSTTFTSAQNADLHYQHTTFASPHLAVPRGVDVNKLRETVLQLPMLPENIRKQLASIEDWQNTLPVPTLSGSGENFTRTTVNGNDGMYFTNEQQSTLYWQQDGQVHLIETTGASTQDSLQAFAKSLK